MQDIQVSGSGEGVRVLGFDHVGGARTGSHTEGQEHFGAVEVQLQWDRRVVYALLTIKQSLGACLGSSPHRVLLVGQVCGVLA